MTRVLLTGAAGFIGSLVAEALVARGDEVVGVDNFDPFYPRPDKERNLRALRHAAGFALHELDILDTAALRPLLTPATVVLHFAAKAGVRPSLADPVGYARVNLTGTASVLEAARQAGVTRLVFASSSSVYGETTPSPFREDAPAVDQISPYAATKRAGELMLGALASHAGFRAAALRLFTVYGPRQRPDLAIHAFARRMRAGEPITVFGDGGQLRDFTYCDDIVAGVVAASDWTARAPVGMDIFNLGGGHPVTLSAVIDLLARAMECAPRLEYRPPMPGDVRVTAADIAKARAVLGYTPRTAVADGIRQFTMWFNDAFVRQS